MNNGSFLRSRKFRHGSTAALLTAFLIAVVVIINITFTALAQKYMWYTDMTTEKLYTLSQEAIDLMDESFKKVEAARGEEIKVDIIFCDEKDNLMAETTQRYVLETALQLQTEFPDIIDVKFIDVWTNPSAVDKYRANAHSNIFSTNVIVASGTEFRVYALQAFYVFSDADSTTPWSYNGEKKLASGILACIQAESPIACFTMNHGEQFYDYELLYLMEDAGYKVELLDLATQEIPADCRMLITYNPVSDFLVKDKVSEISEIAKLDAYLDATNAYMVFVDPQTPTLTNLEEYLEEWGIVFDRSTDMAGDTYSYTIKDASQALTVDGYTIQADYTIGGLGASITTDMRERGYPPKVIFRNTMSISYAENYSNIYYEDEEDATKNFWYGSYYSNGVSRSIYDVFHASANAEAYANGEMAEKSTALDPFKLMTVTRESRMVDNTNADYSYVLACGSTQFACQDMLQSAVYGNTDVLLSALRSMGKELVTVDLKHKPFASADIDTITVSQANQYTIVLTVVPAVVIFGLGIFVMIRRKYA
jgi:hypothetical protein